MSVSAHLGIPLREYDRRIRTFIPNYETMLDEAARALPDRVKTIVDLGVGTGALSARCTRYLPTVQIVGIDADADMLPLARRRLGPKATLRHHTFARGELPAADAFVASLALHHVRTRRARLALFVRIRSALRRGGVLVDADCHPSRERGRWAMQRELWVKHLQRTYSRRKAEGLLRDWSDEDTYFPLSYDLDLLQRAGFSAAEVAWRVGAFAVIVATK
jgi:trans-aconitate methyltransferase